MPDPLTRRWNSVSLRTKITTVTVLLVTLGLLVAGVGTMTVLRNYLLDEVDAKIAATAVSLEGQRDTCETSGPNDYFIAVVDSEGALVCTNEHQDPPPVVSEVTADDIRNSTGEAFTLWDSTRTTQWRVVVVPAMDVDSGAPLGLIVGLNLNDTNQIISRYAGIFLGFGLSVVLLGYALTRLLVTSTFAPLRQVEATAAAIAEGNFSERMPGATPNTEVGRLNGSLNTMLVRIDKALGDRAKTIEQMRRFVGDASHELRTPLVSVRGYAELYRMGALTKPEDVAQAMQRIEKEAIRMGGLVEDLLELARIDEAKPVTRTPVDLVPIAYDAALDTMASSPDRTVSVVFTEPEPLPDSTDLDDEIDDDELVQAGRSGGSGARRMAFASSQLNRLRSRRMRPVSDDVAEQTAPVRGHVTSMDTPAIVLGEENKIRQVVTNLLGNAIRFTPAGSPIEIGVSVDLAERVALLDIVDHGEGIPQQIRDKIFQRFWRADTSRTRETGGSGLGLAIVSGIVAAHDGSVDVLETPGGGATFRVVLPLLPDGWVAPPSPAPR
ncbi:sensor histidine kinase [Marisediminicola senii]|uniref:sensor histidine kinase n=1 Tax=Marisediminicola senii TaxID=2711233 RepID=UPI0013EB686E|nr:HAMP domain-containing sensor histidine kinase [Marisediminicola senii]